MQLAPENGKNKIYFWERIAFRVSLGFAMPVLACACALYSVSNIFTEMSASNERVQRTLSSMHFSESKALVTLQKIRLHALAYQYDASLETARQLEAESREFMADIASSRKSIDSVAAQNGVQLDVTIVESFLQAGDFHKELSQNIDKILAYVPAQKSAEASAAYKELDRIGTETESLISRMQTQNESFESALSARFLERESRFSQNFGFYLFAIFLVGMTCAAFVTTSITSPLKILLNRFRDIATGDGDLTKRVALRSGGEIRELALWLNKFLEKTNLIIATIANASSTLHDTTNHVGTHAEKMTVAASGINRNMVEQSMNLDECTMRVGNIDDLIHNSGESTRQATSLSRIAMDRALQGGASVNETIEAMEKIEETSHKVEELVSSINEIGSQTNLLAINAAIEATKAGEHGKGFAVVAEEVRKLAERARKLTNEVTGLVGESSGRVKAGVGLARAAGVSLDGIIKDVEAVSSLIQRIASGSSKQTESSAVALEVMQKVSEAVRLNQREMEGVSKATEMTALEISRLEVLVGQLNEVVGQFRLNNVTAERGLPSDLSFEAMMNPVPPRIGVPIPGGEEDAA